MATVEEPPEDLEIQKHWRNHAKVTDGMANWLKAACGCKNYHGLKDVSNEEHIAMFNTEIPEGRVCWMKVDLREGAFNVYENNVVYTNKFGRDPVKIRFRFK